ncbi:MAG: hypothetical protein ACOCXA_08545, partial [Planctomycetota bacterium]
MRSSWYRGIGCLCLLLLGSMVRIHAVNVYERVMDELVDLPHRQAGTAEYEQALGTLETVLGEHGLEARRQRFDTLVPTTRTCVLRTAGGDELPARPYFLTSNNNLPSTYGEVLTAPAIWCGSGRGEDVDGLDLTGALAVLEVGAPGIRDVMRMGAVGIILVENESASQWRVTRHPPLPGTPTVWLPREVAVEHGLLSTDSQPELSLELAM